MESTSEGIKGKKKANRDKLGRHINYKDKNKELNK